MSYAVRSTCSAPFVAYRGKFERLGAEMRASGHVNPWIKPESVAAWFVDLTD